MTETLLADVDTESAEYDREGAERLDESEREGYDAEPSSWERERRERARRIALARQQQALVRARSAGRPAIAPSPQRTQAQVVNAVRNLDLETKVQEDAFRRAIGLQRKRLSRSEYA